MILNLQDVPRKSISVPGYHVVCGPRMGFEFFGTVSDHHISFVSKSSPASAVNVPIRIWFTFNSVPFLINIVDSLSVSL